MPSGKTNIKLIGLMFFAFGRLGAQELVSSGTNYGFNVSANFAFGTHFNRAGFSLHFFYRNGQFQSNSEARFYYNFKNLGPALKYPELVLSQGILFAYGDQAVFFNPFLSSISNQTNYRNAVSYAYNLYLNRAGTSQQTGLVALGFRGLSFVAENDILARPTLDRFRTGALMLRYQYEDKAEFALNCIMWTGQFGRKKEIFMIKAFGNNCYMDTVGGKFTRHSHGILSGQVKYNLGYSQNIQLNAGTDAEQVRNALQNKLMHNMRFLPQSKTFARNCHIPMLDTEGNIFLYEEGRQIRRPKLYLNLFSNANVFY